MKPRWMVAELKGGAKQDDFLIAASGKRGRKVTAKRGRKIGARRGRKPNAARASQDPTVA